MPIAALLALLPSVINAATTLVGFIQKTVTTLKQSGELTPEQEKALDDHITTLEAQPWWQPDAS
jgi:hypothetical protein